MSTALIERPETTLNVPSRMPVLPWRDPHTVAPETLAAHIAALEEQCRENPHSAGLRTCLGMAYAMDFQVYKAMDALTIATELEPDHFYARLKYAELQYRLRALACAERETVKALDLATNPFEYGMARHQLQEVRRLMREGTQKPEWSKSLRTPALFVVLMLILTFVVHVK